jgi:UDP-N-acetylglucosamine 2-epimerase
MPTLLTVIGTRPQYIKYAAMAGRLAGFFDETVIDTGQHYDNSLSGQFKQEYFAGYNFRTLGVAGLDGSDRLAVMLSQLDEAIERLRPDLLLCFGDTDSTLAAGLAASRRGLALCHVEAGERSRRADGTRLQARCAPEESNRIIVDHLASLLCCTTREAAANCETESCAGRAVVTGDIMYDLFLQSRRTLPDATPLLRAQGCDDQPFYLCSLHRAVNTDNRERLASLLAFLDALDRPVLLPLHPRTERRIREFALPAPSHSLRLLPPLSHADTLALLARAERVLTDSGGLTREAYFSAIPSICLDDATAWHQLCRNGWCALTGADTIAIEAALQTPRPEHHAPALFGDGNAAGKIARAMIEFFD